MNQAHRLLLLSSSRADGTEFLEHAHPYLADFLGEQPHRLAFVPYAAVVLDYDAYTDKIRACFESLRCQVTSLHETSDPVATIRQSDVILIGGGNTFRLLDTLCRLELLDPIRARVAAGAAYVGWSAGSNVACPTIRTTNDMPVVWPLRDAALALVPFQINPHYTDLQPPGHNGETRDQRLEEFVTLNPALPVVGLREGGALQIENNTVRLLGEQPAVVFHGSRRWNAAPGERLDQLLQS